LRVGFGGELALGLGLFALLRCLRAQGLGLLALTGGLLGQALGFGLFLAKRS
jgi:hypothetical protein